MPDELSLNVKTDESDHKIGSAIGNRFVLLEALGKGTYGSVYRATDKNLEKEVAVKILHYHLLQDSSAVTRFLKEAQSSCRLQHENVIATYAIGQAEDQAPFIVMELGSGITLKDWLLSNKPTFDQILIILRGMTAGLAAAHAQRVVHRDLKPSNVMIAEVNGTPRAKVLDFGIAKVLSISHEQRLTQTGAMLGTPAYMSPEVCTGKNVDERSDLYSLGCILYEMCTGETPFKGGSALDTMGKQLRDSPAPLPPGTPTAFQTLIDRLMAKNPDQRIQSAPELLKEIDAIQASSLKLKQGSKTKVSGMIVVRCAVIAAALIIPYTVAMTNARWVDHLPPIIRAPVLDGLWIAGRRDEEMRKSCEQIAEHFKGKRQFDQEVKWRQRIESMPAEDYEQMVLAKYRLGSALSQAGYLGGEDSTYCAPAIKLYSDWCMKNSAKGIPIMYAKIKPLLPCPPQMDLRLGKKFDAFWSAKHLGSICYEAGDYANADQILGLVVKEEKRHDTVAWELIGELQAYRSRSRMEMNDRAEALKLAKDATVCVEKMLHVDQTAWGNDYRLLGQIWEALDAKKAEQMYLKSIDYDRKLDVPTFEYVTWQCLYQMYVKQGRKAEAAKALANTIMLIDGRTAVGPLSRPRTRPL